VGLQQGAQGGVLSLPHQHPRGQDAGLVELQLHLWLGHGDPEQVQPFARREHLAGRPLVQREDHALQLRADAARLDPAQEPVAMSRLGVRVPGGQLREGLARQYAGPQRLHLPPQRAPVGSGCGALEDRVHLAPGATAESLRVLIEIGPQLRLSGGGHLAHILLDVERRQDALAQGRALLDELGVVLDPHPPRLGRQHPLEGQLAHEAGAPGLGVLALGGGALALGQLQDARLEVGPADLAAVEGGQHGGIGPGARRQGQAQRHGAGRNRGSHQPPVSRLRARLASGLSGARAFSRLRSSRERSGWPSSRARTAAA
jgi:hypothetical protein